MISDNQIQQRKLKGLRNTRLLGVVLCLVIALATYGYYSFRKFLLNDKLNQAVSRSDFQTVDSLLADGADIDGRSLHYRTPLMSAANRGHLRMVIYLLDKGADVNAVSKSSSVLMEGATNKDPSIVRILLSHGADPNWKNATGQTASEIASQYGNLEVCKILLQAQDSDEVPNQLLPRKPL